MIRHFGNRRFTQFFPLVFCAIIPFIAGCVVGPNYKRPMVNSPSTYRGLTDAEAAILRRVSGRAEVVGSVSGPATAAVDSHRASAELRRAHCSGPVSLRLKRSLELHARINFLP